MKLPTNYLRVFAVASLFSVSLCLSHAQADSLLGKFSLSESNGQVALSWQMLAGNTCNGIQIYRSINGIDFTRIGIIVGICGSITEPVNYFFTDTTPVKNEINYYYLEFGGFGPSNTIAIEIIDNGNSGYQLRPHPFQDSGTIFFDAESGKDYTLRMFDLMGKEVFSAETSEDKFDIITSGLIPGQYVFTISDFGNTARLTGKLIVQK